MLTAISRLGAGQTKPTQGILEDIERFLQYAASWPNASIVYKASDMQLTVESDASYLSESKARSKAGGIHYLLPRCQQKPTKNKESNINGATECISTIIPSVVASAFEAEYAALFINGQIAEGLRNTLTDMGYPQGSTMVKADNAAAVGIVSRTVKQRRSKAIDMRYHWIRDRVDQGHFNVVWAPGKTNLADYFTKIHPVAHHFEMRFFWSKQTRTMDK